MKDQAIQHLEQAVAAIKALEPQPESAPGPLQSEGGRAYQALNAAQVALEWLTPHASQS